MASAINIFQYIYPVLVLAIVVVLLCFYVRIRKRRAAHDVTTPSTQDTTSPVHTISLPEYEEEDDIRYDRFPPRYSTVDHPPPYSLFDPKLTSVWPGGPPPEYEMYPITLPLAPHHWTTPTGPLRLSPPSSPGSTHSHPQPQRTHQDATS